MNYGKSLEQSEIDREQQQKETSLIRGAGLEMLSPTRQKRETPLNYGASGRRYYRRGGMVIIFKQVWMSTFLV